MQRAPIGPKSVIHACMYVYMYICMYVCVCMCMYVYVCVCMCMYVYVCVCMYMYVYVCICMPMYVYVCTYACMHACMYMFYLCTYACRREGFQRQSLMHKILGTIHHAMYLRKNITILFQWYLGSICSYLGGPGLCTFKLQSRYY